MKKCSYCGFTESDEHSFCSQCGKPLSAAVEEEVAEEAAPLPQGQLDANSFFRANPVLEETKSMQSSGQQGSLQPSGHPQGSCKQGYSFLEDAPPADPQPQPAPINEPAPTVMPPESVPVENYTVGGVQPPVTPPVNQNVQKKNKLLIGVLICVIALILGSGAALCYKFYTGNQDAKAQMEADENSAQQVETMIASLGTVTLDSEKAINDARFAYDSLTEEQKKLVTNETTLVTAETRLAELIKIETEEQAAKEKAKEEAAAAEKAKKSTLVTVQNQYYLDCWVSANGGLNLRYGPGKNFNVIVLIPDGSYVTAYADQGSWAFVEYNGRQGWVNSAYLTTY